MKAKGKMARKLVYYCIGILTFATVWAMVVTTIAAMLERSADVASVLTFIGAAFGGELLLLLVKRILARPQETEEENRFDA